MNDQAYIKLGLISSRSVRPVFILWAHKLTDGNRRYHVVNHIKQLFSCAYMYNKNQPNIEASGKTCSNVWQASLKRGKTCITCATRTENIPKSRYVWILFWLADKRWPFCTDLSQKCCTVLVFIKNIIERPSKHKIKTTKLNFRLIVNQNPKSFQSSSILSLFNVNLTHLQDCYNTAFYWISQDEGTKRRSTLRQGEVVM